MIRGLEVLRDEIAAGSTINRESRQSSSGKPSAVETTTRGPAKATAGFGAEFEAFIDAIGTQESGNRYGILGPQTRYGRPRGRFQILDTNWPAWTEEAGIPGADWRDPKAQDRVAKYKFLQYYRKFGSWDAVAVAWFAGPGRAKKYVQDPGSVADLSDVLGTSVARYVQTMQKGMADRLGSAFRQGAPGAGPSTSWTPDAVGSFGERLADKFGLKVTSHGRSAQQNAAIGGAPGSHHIGGYALDLGGSTEQMMAAANWLRQFTADNGGPLIELLDPVNNPHGTGPHLHVAFDRESTANVFMPGEMPDMESGVMEDPSVAPKARGLSAIVAAMREGVGSMLDEGYSQDLGRSV